MPEPEYFGVFREESSHGVGDPYRVGYLAPLPRHKGKQFVVDYPQSGQLPGAYLHKEFQRLSE
eukprot:evm.model.scf_3773.2 EVM.evm.TU.scf_3773.2   scf_3773:5983-6320(+)